MYLFVSMFKLVLLSVFVSVFLSIVVCACQSV